MTTVNRREFIKLAGATAACMCVGALGTSSCSGSPTSDTLPAPAGSYRVEDGRVILALSQVGALAPLGGAVKLAADMAGSELKIIVVHCGEGEYRAFADSCTHNGKELNYEHEKGRLACCGRSSRFDLEGNVLRGPAEAALLCFPLRQAGDELIMEV